MAKLSYTSQCHQDYVRYLDIMKDEFDKRYDETVQYDITLENFDVVKAIGTGAYGDVYLVRDKTSFTYHALKVVSKEVVFERKHIKHLILEKQILSSIQYPFTLTLDVAFKDNLYLYFVFPYLPGGEMFTYIQKYGNFSDALSKFYAAQMILALEYLHHCTVIHRDIKPENILIDCEGYLKLCDFGFAKKIKKKTWTLCGTPEYLAPEIILSKGYSYGVDWWALGVLIFEMGSGFPPFYSPEPTNLYEKILTGAYKCPSSMEKDCRTLIKGFLQVDPSKRLGSLKGGVYDIKSHSWFHDISWDGIFKQNLKAPFVPVCPTLGDTSNFPELNQPMIKKGSTCVYEEEFEDF